MTSNVIESLWGSEFDIKIDDLKSILKKSKSVKNLNDAPIEKKLKSKSVSLNEKLQLIKNDVERILGKFKDEILVIRNINDFTDYIDAAINNGIIAIDTETSDENGFGTLDTIDCKLMGLCLYTPGMKAAYIPVNHINRDTNELLKDQITECDINLQLQKLINNDVKCIYHNASFDIEVIYSTCNIMLPVYWDTLAGAKLLNENELAGLKTQYRLHIDNEQEKYDIEHLFKGLPYEIFEPELFALYSATDSLITFKLYEYQLSEFEKEENEDIYLVLKTIEIPIIPVIVGMELRGIKVDLEYTKKMSEIYHKKSDKIQEELSIELEKLKPQIDAWKLTPEANRKQTNKNGKLGKSKVEQLADPIELGSPTQLAILLYDILKVPVIDKKTPRGTGTDILKELSKNIDICKVMLKKREIDILINTFIDKIPEFVKEDGKVHPRFNSMGTVTGRFSSSEPNLQQIPAGDKAIRMMFKADDGYSICGNDYSGQEMRILASAACDKEMIDAYKNNQDIYARVASLIYKNDYADNLEFRPISGELQPEGKKRRANAKMTALALNYGMSTHTLAERMGLSMEDAQKVVDGYYNGLIGVKKYTEESEKMLKKLGYVTDLWGRRRHIPDALLDDYEIKPDSRFDLYDFNPLIGAENHTNKLFEEKVKKYRDKLSKAKWRKDIENISRQAQAEGLIIKNNKGFISRALRQCLNARIQGSAASMTKRAMILIHNDKELNDLGFKLLVTVHDEVFGECPRENHKKVAERLSQVMIDAANERCSNVPWKCDGYEVSRWYLDEFSSEVLKDYNKLIKEYNYTEDRAINDVKEKYLMVKPEYIEQMCRCEFDVNAHEDI